VRPRDARQNNLAAQVDRHHPVVIVHVQIGKAARPPGDAGIAHHDVETAQGVQGGRDQMRQRGAVGHVAGHAGHAELRGHGGRIGSILAGDGHLRAGRDHRLGNGPADAAGRAGDQGHLAIQAERIAHLCSGRSSSSGLPLCR
jgi:hypothetical protein